MSERRRVDVVLDAVARFLGLVPGLWMLWVAVAALLDLPPPYAPTYLGEPDETFPLWATRAQKFWVVPAMLTGALCWSWLVSRFPGWRERLGGNHRRPAWGDRGPERR